MLKILAYSSLLALAFINPARSDDHAGQVLMWKPFVLICQSGIDGNACVEQNADDVMKGVFEPAYNQAMCAKYAEFQVAKVAESLHLTLKSGEVMRIGCKLAWVNSSVAAAVRNTLVGEAGAHKVNPNDIKHFTPDGKKVD